MDEYSEMLSSNNKEQIIDTLPWMNLKLIVLNERSQVPMIALLDILEKSNCGNRNQISSARA